MKIKETLDFFLNLKSNSVVKSEIKIYDKYIGILSHLNFRDLTVKQLESLETKLDELNLSLETKNKKKYLGSKLEEFKKFLKDELSLISEGHYTGYGIMFGILTGLLLQFYIGIYSSLGGILIGMFIGGMLDSEARKQGRVLKTKLTK